MNQQALANLFALGEGFTTEFKRAGTSNLGQKSRAFANATSGVIPVGVTDTGEADRSHAPAWECIPSRSSGEEGLQHCMAERLIRYRMFQQMAEHTILQIPPTGKRN